MHLETCAMIPARTLADQVDVDVGPLVEIGRTRGAVGGGGGGSGTLATCSSGTGDCGRGFRGVSECSCGVGLASRTSGSRTSGSARVVPVGEVLGEESGEVTGCSARTAAFLGALSTGFGVADGFLRGTPALRAAAGFSLPATGAAAFTLGSAATTLGSAASSAAQRAPPSLLVGARSAVASVGAVPSGTSVKGPASRTEVGVSKSSACRWRRALEWSVPSG